MGKINLLVADDHPVFREGLCRILASDEALNIIATAEDGQAAVDMAFSLKPDVALIDVDMPLKTGIQVAKEIKESCSHVRVLMLSAFDYDQYVISCLRAGVDGYLLKTTPPEDLIKTIHNLYEGKKSYDVEVMGCLQRFFGHYAERDLAIKLNDRESTILRLIALGKTNKEIATDLNISTYTLGNHIINIFQKTG